MSDFKVEYSLTDSNGEYVYEEMLGFIETSLKDVAIVARDTLANLYGIPASDIHIHSIYEKVIDYDHD